MTTKKEPAAFLPTVTGNPDSFTGSDESITDVKKNTSSAETNGRKEMANEKTPWRYCVVGNIVKTHIDENETLRYGTVAYSGGTKVYLCGKYWDVEYKTITVVGRNRFGRYEVTDVPTDLIENVRCKKSFRPTILAFMEHWEFGDYWWGNTQEDKAETEGFLSRWNNR